MVMPAARQCRPAAVRGSIQGRGKRVASSNWLCRAKRRLRILRSGLVAAGRDSECKALSNAVRWHCEGRVFLYGNRTVVLR